MKNRRIYIAGPYSGDDIITILGNIRHGIRTAAQLLFLGYPCFCPFLDFLIALTEYGGGLRKKDYQENSMAWLEVCDGVLLIGAWWLSSGVWREIARALELGIPIYENTERICEDRPMTREEIDAHNK